MSRTLEAMKKIVESGNSRIFNNWHEHTGVSQEDFIKGLEWLDEDPFFKGRVTRDIGCDKEGKIHKIVRKFSSDGYVSLYDADTRLLWDRPCINIRDRI